MNEELRERFRDFSDEFLVQQYVNARDEYTQEAVEAMKEELKVREIDPETYVGDAPGQDSRERRRSVLSREDFLKFDHQFARTDLLVAEAVLRELNIPFVVETSDSDTIPLQTEADRIFTLHVHKDSLDKAHEALDEHFEKADGMYRSKYTSVKDRLRALSWHEIHFSESELEEEIEISYADEERAPMEAYVKRLIDEADEVEQKQGRVLFYFDNLEDLLKRLESNSRTFPRADLLAMLETLQVYCDDAQFPQRLERVAEALMDFAMRR